MIGQTVGSYKILSMLSVGGMGTVYRAEHTLIGKLAAVKVLHDELSQNRDIINRFFNEAKATTAIKHPGIVEIFDFNYTAAGHAYITMEFLEGVSLARRVKHGGTMTEAEAAMLLRSVCSALAAAHAKGIVHRDLKPDNIFLVTDPESPLGYRPKILDFGIAKLTDVGLAGTATKTGAVMGTPTYMSPEQCKGTGDVDARADLYSIGCIFYELVTGRPPFTSLGVGELIGAHIYAEPEKPSLHEPVGIETEALIMALLEKKPDKRPQTAKELGQKLSTLAAKLGWVTTTGSGYTESHSLAPHLRTPVPLDENMIATEPPEPEAPKTTPFGAWLQPSQVEVVDKPTTLSGAASQSVINHKRSRKGLAIAMASAALLAGGVVAFVKLRGTSAPQSTAGTAPSEDVTPKPEPVLKTEPVKPEPPPPAPVTTEPEKAQPADKAELEVVKTEPVKSENKPVAKKIVVKKPPPVKTEKKPVPPVKKTEPPKGPKCEQPPCIEREGL